MTEKRRCQVNGQEGEFVQYGQQPYLDDSNTAIGMETIAIVELDNGRVIQVPPSALTFPSKK